MKLIRGLIVGALALVMALLLMLGVILYYGIQNARAALRVQDQAAQTIRDLPSSVVAALHAEGDATRTLVSGQLSGLRADVFRRVDSIQTDTVGQVGNAIAVVNTAELDANARLTDALNQTEKIGLLADQLSETAKPIAHAAQQIDAALPDFLDCHVTDDGIGNPTCLYRRYADVTADFDRMVEAAAIATPQIMKSADTTSVSLAKISQALQRWVDRLTAPPTVKDEIRAWISVVITGLSHAL